jgi:hypothetical protein
MSGNIGMLIVCGAVVLLAVCSAETSTTNGHVVQFVVYAETQADVSKVFPGAYVDYTWNNMFIITIWVENPDTAIPLIRKTIDENQIIKLVIPPYTMTAATQKWLQYNAVWVAMLLLIFVGGCTCGVVLMKWCSDYKNNEKPSRRQCRARF